MNAPLSFVCPLTREDFVGEGTVKHCPQCDLDIPDMSALTRAEAERVLDALRCAHELSQDLHFCSTYVLDGSGHATFTATEDIPAPLLDVSGLVDTTPKLLLAIAALSAFGYAAQSYVFENILSPAWEGNPVLVLDEDGPRLEPEPAHAFMHAVDASEDAWLTLNLAHWRRQAMSLIRPNHSSAFAPADEGAVVSGVVF